MWALVYETVFVVFLPVCLVELIFPDRREDPWIGTTGLATAACSFLLGSYLAWYSWTRIARPKVFHVPAYTPPPAALATAAVADVGFVLGALGPFRHVLAAPSKPAELGQISPGAP